MSERGRDLFDKYILALLADREDENVVLAARIAGLKAAAAVTNVRLSEIEEEVGQLHKAFDESIERELKNASPAKSKGP